MVNGSRKNIIPRIMLVMGSNIPTMDVMVGPAYFTPMGIKEFARKDAKNATNSVNTQAVGVIPNTNVLLNNPNKNK